MIEFNKYRLEDICSLITKGTTPSTLGESFVATGINFVKSESITDYKYLDSSIFDHITERTHVKMARSQLKQNDLLFSIAGAYLGKIGIVRDIDLPLNTNQAVGIVRLNENMADVDYTYYYFSQKAMNTYINKLSSQSAQPNLNLELLGNLPIKLPDLPTQKKIADVLSCIDDKIALNNKTNTELENMAKTIYDYWFTQFDFPNKNGHPYKTSGGQMVYNEILKREIPAGWKAGCFGDLIEIGNGKDHSKLDNGDFPVYGSGGLMRKVNKSLYSGESVLFPRKGTLNNVMYVNETFWTVDTMFYSIPKNQSLALYVYYNAKHFDFEKMNTGTGVPSMTSSIIKELPIIIPDTSILDSFDKTIQPIYQQVFSNRKENTELTKLRDYLLPLLMNGQIEVK